MYSEGLVAACAAVGELGVTGLAERALGEIGLGHSELDAIHSVSDISLAISEKFSGEISVVDLIAELISVLDLIA
jgi:hypothetical protein